MGDRVPFVVGLLAIVAIVAVLVLRGETAQPPAKPAPAPATATGTATRPAPPSLPTPPQPRPELPTSVVPPAQTADETFSEETREAAWAAATEAQITERWKQVRGGKLESLECRQTQCRLVVKGSEDDVATSVADLEGPRGMHGFAQSVMLTNPLKHDDGTISLRVFVRFDRN